MEGQLAGQALVTRPRDWRRGEARDLCGGGDRGPQAKGGICLTCWICWTDGFYVTRKDADCASIEVKDISLTDYVNVNHAVYVRKSTLEIK
jgi:hypothetical protein